MARRIDPTATDLPAQAKIADADRVLMGDHRADHKPHGQQEGQTEIQAGRFLHQAPTVEWRCPGQAPEARYLRHGQQVGEGQGEGVPLPARCYRRLPNPSPR
jgi:hypothetical protein